MDPACDILLKTFQIMYYYLNTALYKMPMVCQANHINELQYTTFIEFNGAVSETPFMSISSQKVTTQLLRGAETASSARLFK